MNLLQVWQFNHRTLAEAIDEAKQHGFDGLLIKAIDGINWMSNFDNSPDALSSVDSLKAQRQIVSDAKLQYYVWTNPLYPDYESQATLTGNIANEVDGLFLDVEPYGGSPPFWGAWRPVGAARDFMQRVRAIAPDAYIVMQPDPRTARLNELRPEEWMDYCDAIAGQHYFNTFGTTPQTELANAALLSQKFGKPAYITLETNTPVDKLTEAIEGAQQLEGVVAYRFDHGSLDAFQFGSDLVTVTFSKKEMLDNLGIIWGWKNSIASYSEVLESSKLYQAAKEQNDAIIEIKKLLSL